MSRFPRRNWSEQGVKVILRAMAKKISWWQAAEILGISERTIQRWKFGYEKYGFRHCSMNGKANGVGESASGRSGTGVESVSGSVLVGTRTVSTLYYFVFSGDASVEPGAQLGT